MLTQGFLKANELSNDKFGVVSLAYTINRLRVISVYSSKPTVTKRDTQN